MIELENPQRAPLAVAAARLEVVLANGARAATPVCEQFYFSCGAAEAGKAGAKARQAVPPALLRETALGQPLGPMELRFPQ